MTLPHVRLIRYIAAMIAEADKDELYRVLEKLPDSDLEQLIALCGVVYRERHTDPTGYAPPRFEGDDKANQTGG